MSEDGYFNGHCLICGAHVPWATLVDHKAFWRRAGITSTTHDPRMDYSTSRHTAWHQQNGEGIPRDETEAK